MSADTKFRTIRAILIDPKREAVEEVSCPLEQGYTYINEMVGCDCFAVGLSFDMFPFVKPNGHVMYVDDEGLLKEQEHHFRIKTGTKFPGCPNFHTPQMQWLAGNGLILRSIFDDDGEKEVDHDMDLDHLRESIEWLHGTNPTDTTPRVFSW